MLKDNPFLQMYPPIYMGEPFRTQVALPNPFWHELDPGSAKIETANLTAVIFKDHDDQYIVGGYMEDGLGVFGPCGHYNDIIAMWRVTEIMPFCKSINQHIYPHLLSAVLRLKKSPEAIEMLLSALVSGDYKAVYQNVMSKKVPKEIIQLVLDSQHSSSVISCSVITEELRAGTVSWNDWDEVFTEARVLRPDQADEIDRRRKDTVARYQKHLYDYAKFVKTDVTGSNAAVITDQVIYLVEKGIEKEHSAEEVLALSAVVGMLSTVASAMIVAPESHTRDEAENEMRNCLILDAAAWLAKHEKKWWKFRLTDSDIRAAVAKLEAIGVKYYLDGIVSE